MFFFFFFLIKEKKRNIRAMINLLLHLTSFFSDAVCTAFALRAIKSYWMRSNNSVLQKEPFVRHSISFVFSLKYENMTTSRYFCDLRLINCYDAIGYNCT